MHRILWSLSLFILFLVPVSATGKVCFTCRDRVPAEYVCSDADTFTARRNARKLGCDITGVSASCKCDHNVSSKSCPAPDLNSWYHFWF